MKALILAGGIGTRLWPLSQPKKPKQLLTLAGRGSLLQKTARRVRRLMPAADILTLTGRIQRAKVAQQLHAIDTIFPILTEPMGKNTAPGIAAALTYLEKTASPDEVVLITPADHLIHDTNGFLKSVRAALPLAEKGYLTVFGIHPTYPETGYGYIHVGARFNNGYHVDRFVEKPDRATAETYLLTGGYYWNSGMVLGRLDTLLAAFKAYAPEIATLLPHLCFKNRQIDAETYQQMPNISMDCAVLEKAERIALVPLVSDWTDLGSWQSVYQAHPKDPTGNVLMGNVIIDETTDCLIHAEGIQVAVTHLKHMAVVATPKCVMIAPLPHTQHVGHLSKLSDKKS